MRIKIFQLALVVLIFSSGLSAQKYDVFETDSSTIEICPIYHSSLIMKINDKVIYVDPFNHAKRFDNHPKPDMLLITHDDPDHFDLITLDSLDFTNSVALIHPSFEQKFRDFIQCKRLYVMDNHQQLEIDDVFFNTLPMYNTSPEKKQFHQKEEGNGYVITYDGFKAYIPGDTEPTKEFLSVKDIDLLFIPINEPYTMSIDMAANAILKLKPKVVYPFHYHGRNGDSDLKKLRRLVQAGDPDIDVRLRDWYMD
jgi:L-ascorbate metabolism protein UlaG (beta-lactamase superfamily)